jgi:hypothetical protein
MDTDTSATTNGSNPILAIGVAIALAMSMVAITFTIFIQSGAYNTVKQIQAGTDVAKSIKMSGFDTKSSIKASDIAKYEEAMMLKVNSLNDISDFGPDQISDTALGLN